MSVQVQRQPIDARQALDRLLEGNQRFLRGETHFHGLVKETLADLANGQRPFATILGCSDSRVPPELIFDSGLGELFVMRVAGNIFTPGVVGSFLYAGRHLQTSLVLVLGHQGCGAVEAALKHRDEDAQHDSPVQVLIDKILPGLPPYDPALSREERMDQAVEASVRWTIKEILEHPEGSIHFEEGTMIVAGAVYEIRTGRVRILDL